MTIILGFRGRSLADLLPHSLILGLGVILALLAAACASPKPTPTATPSPAPAVPTWGQAAEAGRAIFADHCAKCHGDQGQGGFGPAIMGPSATLEKFSTVQGLLTFVSLAMPQDAPGSLSEQGYQEVMGFLLVQNDLVPAQSEVEPEQFERTLLGTP